MVGLIELYYIFFKIGLFSIGGGLATIPFLQQIIVEQKGWISGAELLDVIGIAESTPGPIGVNVATFVGYKIDGIWGGITAVAGLVTPSLIIIIIIAHYFKRFSEKEVVRSSFYGIRPVVAGLIGAAGFEVAKFTLFKLNEAGGIVGINLIAIIILGVVLYLMEKTNKHPIIYIIAGAIIGVVLKL